MNKKYGVMFACMLGLLSLELSAQDFNVPKNYSLKYTVDYATYEPDVLKCVDWLENFPLDKDKDKHDQAYKFLLQWIAGAPNVHVVIQSDFLGLKNKKNVPLLVVYMGAWSKYELQHTDKDNKNQACLSAIRSMIKVYQKGNGLAKDKTIDKLIAMDQKGELEKFVKEKLKKEDAK